MTLENFLVIVCLALLVLCRVGYWYASNTVYIRRKLNEWSWRLQSARKQSKRWRQ